MEDLDEFLNLLQYVMVIVVQGENKESLISQIMGLSDSAQTDLQELIERAMTLSTQHHDTDSQFSNTMQSTKTMSPRAREILTLHEKLNEADQENSALRDQLIQKDKTIRELQETERRLRLDSEGDLSNTKEDSSLRAKYEDLQRRYMEDSSRLEALLSFKENEVFELSREMLLTKQKSESQITHLHE